MRYRLLALAGLVAAAVAYPAVAHADVNAYGGQGCGKLVIPCAADSAAWRYLAKPTTFYVISTCAAGDCTIQLANRAGRLQATYNYQARRSATPCVGSADALRTRIAEPIRGGCVRFTATRAIKAGDIPPTMATVAERWANAILTAPVGKLPAASRYAWGCSWVSTAPRTLRCHFDLTVRPGVVKRGWWDVRYAVKPPCQTERFEDRSGRLGFRNGCIRYGMRPDGFHRIPPSPESTL